MSLPQLSNNIELQKSMNCEEATRQQMILGGEGGGAREAPPQGGYGGTTKVSNSYKTSALALESFAGAQASSPVHHRNLAVASLTNADLTQILSS